MDKEPFVNTEESPSAAPSAASAHQAGRSLEISAGLTPSSFPTAVVELWLPTVIVTSLILAGGLTSTEIDEPEALASK